MSAGTPREPADRYADPRSKPERIVESAEGAAERNVLEGPARFPERPEGLVHTVGRAPAVEAQHAAGRPGSGSVTVVGARTIERMNVPGTGPVMVPFGEEARSGSRPAVTGALVPVAVGKVPLAESVMPVSVDTAGVAVIPVGARVESVRVEVQSVGVPVMSVGVPRVVRPGSRRGVGMGNREEGDQRAEREPRNCIAAAAVPAMVPPPRLRGAGKEEHGRKSEYRKPHRASLPTETSGRAAANVCNFHHTPSRSAASHSDLPRAGVKALMPRLVPETRRREGQPPVKAVRHLPRSAPGKRPTPSTLRALTLMTSRRGLATARAGLSGSSKYMSLTIRT